jgi:hypothetical protein
MSQVVVTKDSYLEARQRAFQQEQAIDTQRGFAKWQRRDPFEPKLLWAAALGGASALLIAMGALIAVCAVVACAATLLLARAFFRKSR